MELSSLIVVAGIAVFAIAGSLWGSRKTGNISGLQAPPGEILGTT